MNNLIKNNEITLKKIFPLTFLLFAPLIANASGYEKNGLPCLEEICIGDGVDELKKVNWDKVNVTPNKKNIFYSTYIGQRDKRLKEFIGNTKNLTNYIGFAKFDKTGIKYLNDVTAVCVRPVMAGLYGTYHSKSGNLTEVEIELLPDQRNPESPKQSWVVTNVKRRFKISSSQQLEEVRNEIDQRYRFVKDILRTSENDYKTLTGNYDLTYGGELTLKLNGVSSLSKRIETHPGCPGATKIRLD